MSVERGVTVQQFYDEKVVCKLQENKNSSLHILENLKDSLDTIELSLAIDFVVALFGPFLRYHICSPQQQLPVVHNSFAVMMASQKQLSLPGLPANLPVCTRKYNGVLMVY